MQDPHVVVGPPDRAVLEGRAVHLRTPRAQRAAGHGRALDPVYVYSLDILSDFA